METKLDLCGTWRLRGAFLDVGPDRWADVLARQEGAFRMVKADKRIAMPSPKGSLPMQVPGDVMEALIEGGILPEPLEKDHARQAMWVGDLCWWLWRSFEVDEALLAHEQVRLTLGTLDHTADILLNGVPIGHHENTFRPFELDVKRWLRLGSNQLILRLTTGYEKHLPVDSLSYYYSGQTYGQRVHLRKPQFTHGWDWCKPVPTCGIGGEVSLTGLSGAHFMTGFRMDTLILESGEARLRFHFEVENLSMCTADDATLHVELWQGDRQALQFDKAWYAPGGLNVVEETVSLPSPALWYPNGYGEQPRYLVKAHVLCRGHRAEMPPQWVGIRTIALDMSPYPDGSRRFDLLVNGIRVFCKGGNWVPADSLYLRVRAEKYRTLVEEAAQCHFNMLRVWGGGLYEPDCFYDACSAQGILVMQDFMYACAYYPDEQLAFLHEATLEADYQTRRLGHQACLALWTGNNEVHESYTDWFRDELAPERQHGVHIFNYMLPDMVRKNTPLVHYMPSSPFYGNKANDLLAGDCHIWGWMRKPHETGFHFTYELEALDRVAEKVRFSSEYGFYGPLRPKSVSRLHAGEPEIYQGDIWTYHGEHGGKRAIIDQALSRHAADPETLDAQGYLLYGGIVQGMLYGEITLALRRQAHCSGQLIWMYNDCWPETGWTVIDYYLTRKIAYYSLKRAFAPRLLIVRVAGDALHVCAINESPTPVACELEVGYLPFEGQRHAAQTLPLSLPAHGRQELRLPLPPGDLQKGICYALAHHPDFVPATSLRGYYRDYPFAPVAPRITHVATENGNTQVTLYADAYVPVAYLHMADDDIKLSDNFVELLPGVPKTLWIQGEHEPLSAEAVPFTPRQT